VLCSVTGHILAERVCVGEHGPARSSLAPRTRNVTVGGAANSTLSVRSTRC